MHNYDLGGSRYIKDGTILPDSILQEWRNLDALYLGAVGTPDVPPGVIERGLLLKMRFELDLYINLRPFVKEATEDSDAHNFTVIAKTQKGLTLGRAVF
ncbi:MAG: hypothetical protein CM15mP49_14130 [Actinomycetota bacterium]|nr:MAG: hypothetical protein CM15mP49_14130 [Actinomycetota bacterium]